MRRIILIILAVLVLSSCGNQEKGASSAYKGAVKDRKKPLSWGKQQKIFVFADDNVWKYAENPLRQTIERTFYTTINEKMFTLERVPVGKLEDHFRFNNLLFYCDASSEQEVSKFVKERLGARIEEKIAADGGAIYPAFNVWADDQLVLFVVGETEESLLKLNILQANEIWEMYRQRYYKRVEYQVYRSRQKPLTNFAEQIWEIDLPARYVLYKKDDIRHFRSYLARSDKQPDRFLSIYHEDMPENILSRDWLIDKRNALAGKYYDGDKFDRQDVTISSCSIAGYEGLKLMGRWQNDKHAMGGAFACFAFWEPELKQVFIIDNSVYYPEGDKLPALIELEIISNSLRIK
ncbi:MAG: membrane lipoprotein lipid attachment site-containing protein [Candidatus Cloacimonetes bacterium]|nr:membrane lipoprotein lipid attachment site-containing protein [Candidatus Cloacimonadota bacterium]